MNFPRTMRASEGRGIEYRAPVDCARKEPPYGSREIVRWVMLDGRRMKRHDNPFAALADNSARARIAYSALVRLPPLLLSVLALFVTGAAATLAVGLLAYVTFGTNTAIILAGVVAVAATLAAMWFAIGLSDRVCEPWLKARGVSHDEEMAGLVAGLAPIALIALAVQVIS